MTARDELLIAFDREMRENPPLFPGVRAERVGPVVRVVGEENMVIYSDLNEANASRVVREQAEFFRRSAARLEWKYFGHDRPPGLEAILASEGFEPEEPETLVVFDLRTGLPGAPAGPGVEVRRVVDAAGVDDAVVAMDAAFGREPGTEPRPYSKLLDDPTQALFVAYADRAPVASGRLELPADRSFAGLYGGGTRPEYRRRGIYGALVAGRAALARDRGYRYLTVDARETSRPILERLGFVPLTTTRPWVLSPSSGPRAP